MSRSRFSNAIYTTHDTAHINKNGSPQRIMATATPTSLYSDKYGQARAGERRETNTRASPIHPSGVTLCGPISKPSTPPCLPAFLFLTILVARSQRPTVPAIRSPQSRAPLRSSRGYHRCTACRIYMSSPSGPSFLNPVSSEEGVKTAEALVRVLHAKVRGSRFYNGTVSSANLRN